MIRILTPDDTRDTVPHPCRSYVSNWPGTWIIVCSRMCHASSHTSLNYALEAWPAIEETCANFPHDQSHLRPYK